MSSDIWYLWERRRRNWVLRGALPESAALEWLNSGRRPRRITDHPVRP